MNRIAARVPAPVGAALTLPCLDRLSAVPLDPAASVMIRLLRIDTDAFGTKIKPAFGASLAARYRLPAVYCMIDRAIATFAGVVTSAR